MVKDSPKPKEKAGCKPVQDSVSNGVMTNNSKPETQNPNPQPLAGLAIRFMHDGEERAVCDMVRRVFDLSVAPLYSEKGQRSFKDYADPEEMSARIDSDHFVLLAMTGGEIVGMIEIRRHRHVSLLFIAPEFQGKGIGGLLLGKAVDLCLITDPQLREMTVNSSPNALRAYERMGFAPTGGEQVICGVRFIPMKKVLIEKVDPKSKI
jgi:GNAT superfamily N-acetyltransferase